MVFDVVFSGTAEERQKVEIDTVSGVKAALMKAFGSVDPALAGYTPADYQPAAAKAA